METIEKKRLEALGKANSVRTRRSRLKQDIHAGRVPIGYVLTEVPDYVETAKIGEVLVWAPKVGRVKARRVLNNLNLSPSLELRNLSQGTRARLLAELGHGSRSAASSTTAMGARGTTSDASSRVASTGLA
jgi:hypothetical protein